MKILAIHPLSDTESSEIKQVLLSALLRERTIASYVQEVLEGKHVFHVQMPEDAPDTDQRALYQKIQQLPYLTIQP